ncbi:endonuclease/exonuclease/phosphatase family protein [Jannaschia sp. Os4]|uniref:endonuclease/exonuclease/phosphatase family protein n=1 Tax=Jannaschia sp. Os4 TaxID=2807617 RepID=UPI00193AD791|nr:endonuclease/exonuclease/phosphatase family protein [Jannaschia sp. Os4]MBM2575935.1 endonuclease/exonuclease/phosphatase family protein [Jannaschia sp. Os4]
MGTIRIAVWNMEWLNTLFTRDSEAVRWRADALDPAEEAEAIRVLRRRMDRLATGLAALDVDLLVVVEGPTRQAEIDLLFSDLAPGDWTGFLQPSKSPNGPGRRDVFTSQQNVAIMARTDRGAFADPPLRVWDAMDPEAGAIHAVSEPFFLDTGADKVVEWYRFERRPAYAEVTLADGARFRVLGVHLKSKFVASAFEWSRYWVMADAARERLLAQCRHLREDFLDPYLRDPETADVPLIVCGDVNDGPGFDTSEMRLKASGIETLMGSVWKPDLTLGNAAFDALPEGRRRALDFRDLATTSFQDPIFEATRHEVWIDHILYSRNAPPGWVSDCAKVERFAEGGGSIPFHWVSDHAPVAATVTLDPPVG